LNGLAEVIEESGATTHVEDLIEKLSEAALDALERDELNPEAKTLLSQMVALVTKRNR
jgi:geranylgeranyl pyrophosphate synthase